jgi:hypothetical protein
MAKGKRGDPALWDVMQGSLLGEKRGGDSLVQRGLDFVTIDRNRAEHELCKFRGRTQKKSIDIGSAQNLLSGTGKDTPDNLGRANII